MANNTIFFFLNRFYAICSVCEIPRKNEFCDLPVLWDYVCDLSK